jgi:hypothetical protein
LFEATSWIIKCFAYLRIVLTEEFDICTILSKENGFSNSKIDFRIHALIHCYGLVFLRKFVFLDSDSLVNSQIFIMQIHCDLTDESYPLSFPLLQFLKNADDLFLRKGALNLGKRTDPSWPSIFIAIPSSKEKTRLLEIVKMLTDQQGKLWGTLRLQYKMDVYHANYRIIS